MSAVRERFVACLGSVPPRPRPAPPRIERRWVEDGIAYERWTFAGPREPIPAWFLVPAAAAGPLPTVLAIHPHGRQFEIAKSWVAGLVGDPSRAYGQAAARAGFGVLAPDLAGFEDRRPPLAERKASYALQGEAYERVLAMSALVEGSSLQAWILADLATCVDVLECDARVDARRIAALGQSFGGQEVVLGMLFDPRLAAGVASCGFSRLRLLVDRRISHNLALYVPGLLPDLDFEHLVPSLAPRPLCVLAGARDAIYPIDGVRQVEARARAAYAALGAESHLRVRIFDGGHDLPPEELASALVWLREVL